jgi:hypothetical protein
MLYCSGASTNVKVDRDNCGACDKACDANKVCINGICK